MKLKALSVIALLLVFAFAGVHAAPASAVTTSRPLSAKTTASTGCNCRCSLHHYDPICARNSHGDRDTFGNQCQLACYNCTHDTDFRVVLRKACS